MIYLHPNFYIQRSKIRLPKQFFMNYTMYMEDRLKSPVTFSLKQTISNGFSHFGNNAGAYVGYTFVYGLIILVASGIGSAIPLNIGGYIVKIMLSNALVMGYALYCHNYVVNQTTDFGIFFSAFRTNYTQLVVANGALMLILGIASALLILPYSQEIVVSYEAVINRTMDPEDFFEELTAIFSAHAGAIIGYFVIATVIQILYLLTNYFIVFFDFGFWEALEASRILMSKVFFKAILLFVVMSLILILGSIVTLGLGAIILYPAVMLMTYSLFEQIAVFNHAEPAIEDELIV